MEKINRNDICPCGSGKKYKHCCARITELSSEKKYINDAHRWMDERILNGRYPDLYGFLILVDHDVAPDEIWEQLKYWSERYIDCTVDRSRKFHRIIDEAIEHQSDIDRADGYPSYFCHKGCSKCCYQPVACTDDEAQLINEFCAEHGIPVDHDKLERQRQFMEFDSDGNFTGNMTWDNQPEEDRACVFLDESAHTCMIWEVRPFVCRVHLAEETDMYCRSTNGVIDTRARGIHYPICSYILSAVFTIHHDSVGKMLHNLLCARHKT